MMALKKESLRFEGFMATECNEVFSNNRPVSTELRSDVLENVSDSIVRFNEISSQIMKNTQKSILELQPTDSSSC